MKVQPDDILHAVQLASQVKALSDMAIPRKRRFAAGGGAFKPSLRPAVRHRGKVYHGETHLEAMNSMPKEDRLSLPADGGPIGYVDDRGRFLGRGAAMDYARNYGLIDPRFKSYAETQNELPSEWLKRAMGSQTQAFAAGGGVGYPEGDVQAAAPHLQARAPAGELPVGRGVRGGAGELPAPGGARHAPEADLEGLPKKVTVPGVGRIEAGHNPHIREVARSYMEENGLPYRPPTSYAKVDPERAGRIAQAFEAMEHQPEHPLVRAAYSALAHETMAQYHHAKKHGLKAEFWDPETEEDPYGASPRLAIEDISKNNHMHVFPTYHGYGTGEIPESDLAENPLLADSGERWNGKPVAVNDIFRAVHDYFGHAKEGVGFRHDGEENAWRHHMAMYSPLARIAATTETRGQNSWLNFGPYGDHNKTARTEDTVFAPQKIGALPPWVMHEGAEDFTSPEDQAEIERLYQLHGHGRERRADGGKTSIADKLTAVDGRQRPFLPPEHFLREGHLNDFLKGSVAPRVLYHGTGVWDNGLGDIRSFDREAAPAALNRKTSMDQVGHWFSETPDSHREERPGAGMYAPTENGAIYPVHARITNPWRPRDFDHFLDQMHIAAGRDPKAQKPRGLGSVDELRAWLKGQGHDGIYFSQGLDHKNQSPTWVALDPEQIKSAVGNRGTFDRNSPDITRAAGGAVDEYGSGSGMHRLEAAHEAAEHRADGGQVTKVVRPAAELPQSQTGLFDMSTMAENPKVPQYDLPRYDPPRGPTPRIKEAASNPAVLEKALEVVRRGEKMGGGHWYNAEPLRHQFGAVLGSDHGDKAFRRYMDFVAATSPRSKVGENARNASYYYHREMSGQGMPQIGDRNPSPYGHIAQRLHQQNAQAVSGHGWDPLKNPKPASFAENLSGNMMPGTIDTHAFRLLGQLAQDPRFLKTAYKAGQDSEPINYQKLVESGEMPLHAVPAVGWDDMPKNNEYAAAENFYKHLGRAAGLSTGQTQASAWVGGGEHTGLASDSSKSFMEFLEDRILKTATETGRDPQDVLHRFIRGEEPLKARGGSVDDALRIVSSK